MVSSDLEKRLKLLSPQEIRVLKLVWDGLGMKRVAEELQLSLSTVHTYAATARRKLWVESTKEAADIAHRADYLK
jgi:DNA-binding NarL/FixJ family response regulator